MIWGSLYWCLCDIFRCFSLIRLHICVNFVEVGCELQKKYNEGHDFHVRFTYNEDSNVTMTVNWSASQKRSSGYLSRQKSVSWVQANALEQEFSMLKANNEQKQSKLSEYSMDG